jgi:prolyl-tRNA editing enzyme YbaK/EbsC (Cys-tRNA(Pro) deacylase)
MTAQLQIEQREAKTARLVALADQRTSQRVDALAAKHGVSRANVIRALVLRGLDQEQGA